MHLQLTEPQTHFGYQQVPEEQKAHKVAEVFHSVAAKYDVMNDLMSAGLHRVWKAFTVTQAGIRPGFRVLDLAGGTGDLARAFVNKPSNKAISRKNHRQSRAVSPRSQRAVFFDVTTVVVSCGTFWGSWRFLNSFRCDWNFRRQDFFK